MNPNCFGSHDSLNYFCANCNHSANCIDKQIEKEQRNWDSRINRIENSIKKMRRE